MPARESLRGLWRGVVVGTVFLVLIPGLLLVASFLLPSGGPGRDMFSGGSILAILTLVTKVLLTTLEIAALVMLFGWLTRNSGAPEQGLYAMLGLGGLMFVAPFLY